MVWVNVSFSLAGPGLGILYFSAALEKTDHSTNIAPLIDIFKLSIAHCNLPHTYFSSMYKLHD